MNGVQYWIVCCVLLCWPIFAQERVQKMPSDFAQEIAQLRYRVTQIDVESTNKLSDFLELARHADAAIKKYPDRAEPLVWKGIALAARAKYQGLSALAVVREARDVLERAIHMDPSTSDAAAYNALGMLYHKVPGWPVSFGSNRKARDYFEKAIAQSSNLDTCFRYGEFLLDIGETQEGLRYLKRALEFPERSGRPEDLFKRKMIADLMQTRH